MKSRMNKLMSLCLVAMMGTTFIPQPIQAEEVGKFEEESFEEATVEFEEATFEEEKNQVAESNSEKIYKKIFEDSYLKYGVTSDSTVEVIGFADGYQPTRHELQIPGTVSKQDESYKEYTVTSIGQSAFEGCERLEEVRFDYSDNKIETIGKSAFKDCYSLRDISFSNFDNIKTIGESAFEGCTSLKDLHLPESLKTIGKRAFFGCYNLNSISFATFGKYDLEMIGESAFEGCTSLRDLYLLETLKTIGKRAFFGCHSLKNVHALRDSNFGPYVLETIGESAFENCNSLNHINFPESLKTIDKRAFFGCYNLRAIYFNNGLKIIGESAFKGCGRLERIILPEGLDTIGESAFELLGPCLMEINIPSTVKELNHIFGKKSNDHMVTSPFKEESTLIFQGDKLPQIDSEFFDLISDGEYKPIIYFPEDAMEIYAGEKSPFVEAGLINPKLFDSCYEFIQLCPKNGKNNWNSSVTISRLNNSYFMQPLNYDYVYDQSILDRSTNNPIVISSKELTGETIFSYRMPITVDGQTKYLTSEANKIKFKVAHRYVWVVEKEPTKDEPGSKYQYCVKCEDAKAPVTIPPTGGGSGGGSTGGGSGGGSTGGSGGSSTDSNAPTQQVENAVYRAYNPYNGEHLYTTNYGEFKVITKNGWNDEGIAFMSESKEKGQAVYRVYNPNSGLHHYTTNVNEKNALVSLGWNDEGVAFYTSKNPKDTPVYRVYNGNDGNHHYTMNANEALALISMGWKNEGIAFFTTPMK